MKGKVHKIWIDCETYSEIPLPDTGVYPYIEGGVEVMLITYAIDDGPVCLIDLTRGASKPLPRNVDWYELVGAMHDMGKYDQIWAHNVEFDRNVLSTVMKVPPLRNWRDTSVQARAHALPSSLGKLCDLFKLGSDKAKIKEGKKLIQFFCKPTPKNHKLRRNTSETHPEKWERFKQYARQDVEAMRALHNLMPKINYPNNAIEVNHWWLDQEINGRGFFVDDELVDGAIGAIEQAVEGLHARFVESTGGAVEKASQRDKFLDYMAEEFGHVSETLRKEDVDEWLKQDIPEKLREVLEIRQQIGSTSTAKYAALKNVRCKDGRARGQIVFCGAKRTKRAAGQQFQPQNLPSRGLLPAKDIHHGIACFKQGTAYQEFPDNLMKLASSAIRGCVIAPPGKKLCISDLANIEGRLVAWVAGQEDKLQAFREYDAGTGPDLYRLAYSKAFRVPVEEVDDQQRRIGKVMELMLGYGGGVGAYTRGAADNGFNMEELTDSVWDTLPTTTRADAADFLDWSMAQGKSNYGLSDRAFVTSDTLKRLWRKQHGRVVSAWSNLEEAFLTTVKTGRTTKTNMCTFRKVDGWLFVDIPGGNSLCYPQAGVDKSGLYYYGEDSVTTQWTKISTYGGKLMENICQAIARNILYAAMPWAENAGYDIVLHVHDELVTEVPATPEYSGAALNKILSAGESWTKGLPLAAEGIETNRYQKA